jgi:dTDP-4-amino-4,6-dideoxygalactose transaminase
MTLTETQIEKLLNSPLWPSMTEQQMQDLVDLVESVLEAAQ